YATLDYEDAGWREGKLVKLQLLVNKQPVDAICRVVHTSQVDRLGRQWVSKFKEHVQRQMFGKFSIGCGIRPGYIKPEGRSLTFSGRNHHTGRYGKSYRCPRDHKGVPERRARQAT